MNRAVETLTVLARCALPAVAGMLLPGAAAAQQPPQTVSIPSGDTSMSARLLPGEGEGPRPAIILFNGFPAGPNIPRAAVTLQAAGYTVLVPQYRGTGHSQGVVSLIHSREDGAASVAWLRDQGGIDAARIGVFGVSYGGWVAIQTAAADPQIRCVLALVPADFGTFGARWATDATYRGLWKTDLESIAADPEAARFGPAGVEGFLDAAVAGRAEFSLTALATDFRDRPVFVAGGRQDPAAPFDQHYRPLVEALRAAEVPFTAVEFQGGHNPSEATAAAIGFVERSCFPE